MWWCPAGGVWCYHKCYNLLGFILKTLRERRLERKISLFTKRALIIINLSRFEEKLMKPFFIYFPLFCRESWWTDAEIVFRKFSRLSLNERKNNKLFHPIRSQNHFGNRIFFLLLCCCSENAFGGQSKTWDVGRGLLIRKSNRLENFCFPWIQIELVSRRKNTNQKWNVISLLLNSLLILSLQSLISPLKVRFFNDSI